MTPVKAAELWNVRILATVRRSAAGGMIEEAQVTLPVPANRLPDDVIESLLDAAKMARRGVDGGDGWD